MTQHSSRPAAIAGGSAAHPPPPARPCRSDNVVDGEQCRGDDAAAARRAEHHHRFAVFGDNGRAHRAQRVLAGCYRVRLALHQAVEVRHTDLRGEVVHLVVQQHAGLRGGNLGTEPVVQRVAGRDRVAPLVDDRVVCGVAALMWCEYSP